ncbi:hypothetical protein D3C85_506040 [compost metagenome]
MYQCRRMVLLRQLVAIRQHRQRQVHPGGDVRTQGLVEGNLAHRGLQQIGAAHYLRDAAVHVIHHHRQVVGVEPVPATHDEVLLGERRRHRNMALQLILEVVDGIMLAQAGGAALCRQPQGAAVAVVEAARRHDLAPGAAAPVEIPGPVEPLDDLVVAPMAPALVHHLSIPAEAMGLQSLEDELAGPGHLPRWIYVLDAHQPAPLLRSRLQEAAKGGDQGAEVERTGRGGGEAAHMGSNRGGGSHGHGNSGRRCIEAAFWDGRGKSSIKKGACELPFFVHVDGRHQPAICFSLISASVLQSTQRSAVGRASRRRIPISIPQCSQ